MTWGFKENASGDARFSADHRRIPLARNSVGLYRFDGTRFELFHSPFGDELLSAYVFSLLALPSGGLWIGYGFGGFSFLNNGRVTNYEISSMTGTIYGVCAMWRGKHLGCHVARLVARPFSLAACGVEANALRSGVGGRGDLKARWLWAAASRPDEAVGGAAEAASFDSGMIGFVAGFTLDADGKG